MKVNGSKFFPADKRSVVLDSLDGDDDDLDKDSKHAEGMVVEI